MLAKHRSLGVILKKTEVNVFISVLRILKKVELLPIIKLRGFAVRENIPSLRAKRN